MRPERWRELLDGSIHGLDELGIDFGDDTVGSFGVPGNNIGYNLGLPPNVQVARQAVAADEQRYLFPLTPLGSGDNGRDLQEIFFQGDHSDIGRGHGNDTRDLS